MSARYSQEFKLKALTMLDQGATISDVRTGLGADSPDRSTVFRWYQQQQETGQHRAASHRRGKASANTIGLVVANILVRNATPRDTAAAYDVHAESARQWSRRYQPDPDTVDITDFTAVAEATMVLVTNSRKKHKSAPIKRRAATKVTQTPIVPNLPPIDDNGSIEPGRSAASPKATGGDQPASTRTPTSPGTASPALTPEGLPDDPDVLKQMLIDERIHRAVAEAKVVLLGKDGVPASNRDATDLIDYLRVFGFRPVNLYGVLGIAKSTYLRLTRSRTRPVSDKYGWLKQKITALATAARDGAGSVVLIYGYRKIHRMLAREGTQVSEKIIRRLMVELHLNPTQRRVSSYRSYTGENEHKPDNLLLVDDHGELPAAAGPESQVFTRFNHTFPDQRRTHDFHADAPFQRLVTDVTELKCLDGKVYLSPMIDLYDGMPISVSAGTRPSMELVMMMLTDTLGQVPAGMTPIIHSDRGFHYRARAWVDAVHGAEGQGSLVQRFIPSMSRKATSGDNAVAEGFFGTLKRELFGSKKATWQMTRAQVLAAVDRYLEWYIWGRINARLDYRTIAEYRGLDPQPDFSLAA